MWIKANVCRFKMSTLSRVFLKIFSFILRNILSQNWSKQLYEFQVGLVCVFIVNFETAFKSL